MILIKNRQRKIKVDIKKLHARVEKMLGVLGYQDFDLGILLTTNRAIRKINKQFRGKDKPTDVLSFPFHDYLKPGQRIQPRSPEDKNLGDIIISVEYAQKNGTPLITLLAHGIAHLIGYDHLTDEQFKKMQKVEKRLILSS